MKSYFPVMMCLFILGCNETPIDKNVENNSSASLDESRDKGKSYQEPFDQKIVSEVQMANELNPEGKNIEFASPEERRRAATKVEMAKKMKERRTNQSQ